MATRPAVRPRQGVSMSALIHPKTITVDGLSVRYAEGGQDSPDAILMSPWPESVYAFEPAWPHLAAAAHLVAIDPPGFGWTKIQVIWDLSVTALDSASCRYTNQVLSYPTPAFLETLKVAGISFEDAVADRQAATDDHNRRETALYAQSLERKALAGLKTGKGFYNDYEQKTTAVA